MENNISSNKNSIGDPVFLPELVIVNKLRHTTAGRNDIRVVITKNPDYQLAEVIAAYASFASSIYSFAGAVATGGRLAMLVRTLSLLRNTKGAADLLNKELPSFSVLIPAGARVNIYDAFRPYLPESVTDLITRFGGQGLSVVVITTDLQKSLIFNSELDATYFVDDMGLSRGADKELHLWNCGLSYANLLGNASPCLAFQGDNLLLLYRNKAKNEENLIAAAEFDGATVNLIRPGLNNTFRIMDGMGAVEIDGKLCIAGRQHTTDDLFLLRARPGQLHSDYVADDEFLKMGCQVVGRPSVTNFNNKVAAAARKRGNGKELIVSIEGNNNSFTTIDTLLKTDYPPAICYFNDKLYVISVESVNGVMAMASSTDGQTWTTADNFKMATNVPFTTSASPVLVVYKSRMYVIYRHRAGNAILYGWTENGVDFKIPPKGLEYFGFNSTVDPAAVALTDGRGIMVAGIKPEKAEFYESVVRVLDVDILSGPTEDAIVYTIFVPWERATPVAGEEDTEESQ